MTTGSEWCRQRWRPSVAMVAVVLLLLTGAVSGGQAAPSDGATADAECTPSDAQETELSHVYITATDETITPDTPAKISGQATAPHSNPCPVAVQMVMTVPTGMYVSGTSSVSSGGQGTLTSSFRVSPGETVTLSANVFSADTGSNVVLVDFEYYPVGHPTERNRLSGLSLEITTTKPNPGPIEGTSTTDSGIDRTLLYAVGGVVVGVLVVVLRK